MGDVNLSNRWEVSLNFDKNKKTLLLKPELQNVSNEEEFSQGDALLNTLLTALSGIEYPVELDNLKSVRSEFYNQLWTLNMDVADVYSAKDKLFIELIPTVQISSTNKQ